MYNKHVFVSSKAHGIVIAVWSTLHKWGEVSQRGDDINLNYGRWDKVNKGRVLT